MNYITDFNNCATNGAILPMNVKTAIAMDQDPILQKAMDKWEHMSQDASFRQAYEAREKIFILFLKREKK